LCWLAHQCHFLQKWRASQIADVEWQHDINIAFSGGRATVQGLKGKQYQVESFLQTELGAGPSDWFSLSLSMKLDIAIVYLGGGARTCSGKPTCGVHKSNDIHLFEPERLLAYAKAELQASVNAVT